MEIITKGKVGRSSSHAIDNVFLVENLKHNLLSISQFCDKGNFVNFTSKKCIIFRSETWDTILEGIRKGNTVSKPILTCLSVIEEDPLFWHKRLGHASFSLINTLRSKDLVRGLPSLKYQKDEICDPCAKGKHVMSSFKPTNVVTTSKPLELIHMDLCGPMRIQNRSGKWYVFVIIDDYSRFTWTLFLISKDEAFNEFLSFANKIEKSSNNQLIHIRSDHGKEFENSSFMNYCNEHGISHNFSAPRTPQ